jgi:hypothetical protein
MLPEDQSAGGLRRNGSGSYQPAFRPHQRLPETAAHRGFSVHRSCRARRAAHRAIGRGYAAMW